MLDRNELMRCEPSVTRDLPSHLVHDARIDPALAKQMVQRIRAQGDPETAESFAARAQDLADQFSQIADVRDALIQALRANEHVCVLRNILLDGLPLADRKLLLITVMACVCELSDSTAYAEHSGDFADEVRPSLKETNDPTYQFDTEVHADESSKLRPEDVVALFAVQAAQVGGESLLWCMDDVMQCLSGRYGKDILSFLRGHAFPFGGILRQPPRILRAPILFGDNGVRFRLGGIMDAFAVLEVDPSEEEIAALSAFVSSVRTVAPYQFAMGSGDGVVMLNRQVLHSRTQFRDPNRLLLRIRGNNDDLSITEYDSGAKWSDEAARAMPES